MPNERLRDAMQSAHLTTTQLAKELGVDPKTVERWITKNREPYPKHRHAVAARLGERERYLWPFAVSGAKAEHINESEVVKFYSHRSAVPGDLWDHLLEQTTTAIDILVYVGMFLTEKPDLLALLMKKASEDVHIRLLFGARDSDAVIQRSLDEGIGRHTISAKIDHAVAHFRELANVPGIEIRTHGTILYNSIYRFDDELIVNSHVFGKIASHAPAVHLRRLSAGDLFTTYLDSLNAVWHLARPLQ